MKAKKIPKRKCVACGEMKEKKELLRIVRRHDGEILVDPRGKLDGRGCYICKDAQCFAAAKKMRKLERAFSCKVDGSVYDELEKELGPG